MEDIKKHILDIAKTQSSINSEEFSLFEKFINSEFDDLLKLPNIDIDSEGVNLINDYFNETISTEEIFEGWREYSLERAREFVQTFKTLLLRKCSEDKKAFVTSEHLLKHIFGHLMIEPFTGLPVLPTLILCGVLCKITEENNSTVCQFIKYYA
ncbi:MAG: hypothetical protein IPP04_06815 [Saprospiraceae bacterium]|nr:hypothetical protein [Saprospiraceae bacterium]